MRQQRIVVTGLAAPLTALLLAGLPSPALGQTNRKLLSVKTPKKLRQTIRKRRKPSPEPDS